MTVFCGSSEGKNASYLKAAKELGRELASQDRTLIYGGAQVGWMGAIANSTLENKGNVIGVISRKLQDVEIAHEGLTELHVVATMHERKAKMASLSDGFIALPGGAGTLEEWFEVFTWAQLSYHQKPCGLLNVHGLYDPLLSMIDHTIQEGFMKETYRDMIIVDTDPKKLLEKMDAYKYSYQVKWQ